MGAFLKGYLPARHKEKEAYLIMIFCCRFKKFTISINRTCSIRLHDDMQFLNMGFSDDGNLFNIGPRDLPCFLEPDIIN